MFRLPKPTSFSEGQRQFFGIAMVLAGIAFCLLGTALTGIFIWGPWSKATEALRLYLLGGALASYFMGSIAVIISMAVGGPVGRIDAEVSKDGFKFGATDDGEKPAPIIVNNNNVAGSEGPVTTNE